MGLLPTAATSGVLACLVNASAYITPYVAAFPERFAFCPLVTDLEATGGQSEADRKGALAALRACNPTLPVGTYLSSQVLGGASAEASYVPTGRLPATYHAAGELVPEAGASRVALGQPVARAKMAQLFVAEAVRRGRPVVFADNFVYDASGTYPPWSAQTAHLAALAAGLHAQGIAVVANVALPIGAVPLSTCQQLAATGADGIAFEMGLGTAVAADPAQLAVAVASYRALLDAGALPILIPGGTSDAALIAEATFQAGLALALYGPLVAFPVYLDLPAWYWWPTVAGAPTGALAQAGSVLTRAFAGGTVTVNCVARTATLTLV